ncbi:MAG TPA: hypothetical protein DEP65_01855 [Ruminococcus sp.]|nr:hypothetical protein [Ruminococcus sp.]
MDERLVNIKKEIDDMKNGNLESYGMKPVDFQLILVLARGLTKDGKALTFHKNMAEYFNRHGFTVRPYDKGMNWLISD